ncbi:phosphatidic acid phosphatase type 2/haloperoxidase [Mycena floridula]|nr:phosphatidic acid phosphatase type 2/haloperoxidase [Mycena floridula]
MYARLSDLDSTTTMPPSSSLIRRRVLSYLPDWIITLVLAAIFFSLNKVDNFKREFSLSDTSLLHPFAVHERVPDWALYVICFVAPVILQPIINLITIRSWWDFHNSTLGLILALALTGSITQFTKITVGRPRPDVIDRCQPPLGSVDPIFGLSNYTICTQTNMAMLNDGFRSFPSGHSSLSFAGLGFMAYYLAGKLHLFDDRGHAGKAWIALTPFAGAALVAISRTMDYRHHWQDVLVGAILGTTMSYFAYRQYFHPLNSDLSHRPYSPRIKRAVRFSLGSAPNGRPVENIRTSYSPPRPTRRYTDDDEVVPDAIELEESSKRPGPGPLHEVWARGESAD